MSITKSTLVIGIDIASNFSKCIDEPAPLIKELFTHTSLRYADFWCRYSLNLLA
ncbi:hypothetical protein G9F72_013680 [Clostridium estertheticum]|uniref:hypothetical protein n=1 Tax=Clostridium estertheticum TaxID=238834 RepID=UPI001CD11099|nr:hypothetical protein [Clostridium estertheticum]MBZ9687377.1 hypothetical protein [Clostridium estertheticum]